MLRMWTYDLAREQSPTLGHLRELMTMTREAGYSAIGLYLEHRFAYPSAPWAHGRGCLQPETVAALRAEFPEIAIIPFVNLLGHCEGFLYTEGGRRFAEERFKGMQACPSNPAFQAFALRILDDVLEAFDAPIIHIGGDEAQQLGACPVCRSAVESLDAGASDGVAELYADWMDQLADRVRRAGRRPAIWGDMLLAHPQAMARASNDTLVFHWEYHEDILAGATKLRDAGLEVVLCPTLHTYNAPWLHVPQSSDKASTAARASKDFDGYCLTTWEQGLFGSYEALVPAIRAGATEPCDILAAYAAESQAHGDWARIMGVDLPSIGGVFGYGPIRSALKCRFMLYGNPFLLWLRHGEELCGQAGDEALAVLERAIAAAPDAAYRGIAEFVKCAIEFTRYAEQARQAYAQGVPGLAVSSLAPCRQIFEHMEKVANASHHRFGGSLADIERARAARRHVELVIQRIREYGDGSLGYLPAFEVLTHPKFMPHDQASWWLINRWANE